jgi:hypothetical protein
MITELIYTALSSSAALMQAVEDRIYPNQFNQGEDSYPLVVYRTVSTVPHADFDGPSQMDFVNIDVWSYGSTRKQAESTAALVRAALDGYSTGSIQYIHFRGSDDDYLSERRCYIERHEYQITLNR